MKGRIGKYLHAKFSLANVLSYIFLIFSVTFAILGGLALWAQMVNGSMLEPQWKSPLFWIVLALSVVAGVNPKDWLRRKAGEVRMAEYRSNLVAQAFGVLREAVKLRGGSGAAKATRSREVLIQAAEHEVRSALSVSEPDRMKVNLVFVVSADRFRVVARSRPGNDLVEYPMNDNAAVVRAMRTNKTIQVDKAKPLKEGHERTYKSVAATPMAVGSKSFGAISVDSDDANCFKGREAQIDRILRPYAAAILVTVSDTDPHVTCPERIE